MNRLQYTSERTLGGQAKLLDNCLMSKKVLTFRETLSAAAKSIPNGWDWDNDKIRLPAISRYLKKKGYPVSQPTLHRHYHLEGNSRELKKETVEALHFGLGIPRAILRGEAMSTDLEQALVKNEFSTILLAERIEKLPKAARRNIVNQIDEILEREEALKNAYSSGNVTSIKRNTDR